MWWEIIGKALGEAIVYVLTREETKKFFSHLLKELAKCKK